MPDGLPTTDDVAAIVRVRAKGRFGADTPSSGTFDENTNPTAEDVQSMITKAARLVFVDTGPYTSIPEDLQPVATDVIALRAAMMVELSVAPEQTVSDTSVYAVLEKEFASQMKSLVSGIRESVRTGQATVAGDGAGPRSNFPAPSGVSGAAW